MKKKNRLKLIVSTVFILELFLTNGQEALKQNKYNADFDYFVKSLTEIHPDPYTVFNGQIEFFKAKTKFRNEIETVTDDYNFTIILNKFISRMKDGHTFINIPRHSDLGQIKKLPIKLKAASDFLFIQNAVGKHKSLIGKVIVAINDVPIENLLQEAEQLRSSENISGAYYNLIKLLETNYSIIPLLGNCNSLKLTFKNEQEKINIPFQTEPDLLISKSHPLKENNNGLLYWQMIGEEKNIGYLAWNSVISREYIEWVNTNQSGIIESQLSWPYRFLTQKRTGNIEKDIQQIPSLYEEFYLLLKEMNKKEAKHLIIDLRVNRGGMTPLIEPLLYLLRGDKYLTFDFEAEYIKKISLQYANNLGFKSINDLNRAWQTDYKVGDYQFIDFGNYKSYLPQEERKKSIEKGYQGFGAEFVKKASQYKTLKPHIIILSSPKTFSAAFHFMYFLKKLGNTTIIGVASQQAGNSFMETTNIELPSTKLTGSISNAKQILFKNKSELGKILKPDIEMHWVDYQKYGFDKHAEILNAIEFIKNNK